MDAEKPKKAKRLKEVAEVLEKMPEVGRVIPLDPVEKNGHYHDQESEWEDAESGERFIAEESETRHVLRDLNHSDKKGLATQTELTEAQTLLLTQFRILEHAYPDLAKDLSQFPEWLEAY